MLQHISRIHSSSPTFHITCGLDECLRTYTNYGSYQKHVKKMHSHYFGIAEGSPSTTDNIIVDDISMAELDQEYNDEGSTSCVLPPLSEIEKKCLRAKWVLKIRETNSLTQSCTEKLLNDITDMCADIIDELKEDIFQNLKSASTPSPLIEEINAICDDVIYRQPFMGLETQYKQQQFYIKHLNFVVRFCVL